MTATSYVQQTAWGWQIAAYLFLGGLGGAVGALGIGIERFVRKDSRIGFVSALAGFVLLSLGSLLLVVDLLAPLNSIYFWRNPSSWIFWGILSLSGYLATSLVYSIACLETCMKENSWVKPILEKLPSLQKWQGAAGIASILLGTFVTVYTGFLLSTAPGVPLWHTAALPLLFAISAFSTGCAFLMLLLWRRRHELHGLMAGLAKADAALISAELLVLFALYNTAGGAGATGYSIKMLLGNWVFVIGFLVLGLTIPLVVELVEIYSREESKLATVAAGLLPTVSVFILIGGYLLRHYTLVGGYFEFPW